MNPINTEAPLNNFSQCHAGIANRLGHLAGLPALLEPAAQARAVAGDLLKFFDAVVRVHHAEEEQDLFPAVLRSAAPGEERALVGAMIDRLTAEHRAVEEIWDRMKSPLKRVAEGRDVGSHAEDFNADLRDLVTAYRGHAAYEETHFLPLSEKILGRNDNHMAALGLSLHLRHAQAPAGYL